MNHITPSQVPDVKVVKLLSEVYMYKEIKRELNLPTTGTLEKKINAMRKKHNARTRAHLVAIFIKKGLI